MLFVYSLDVSLLFNINDTKSAREYNKCKSQLSRVKTKYKRLLKAKETR